MGAGSAGKRHLKNFASLGCRVSAMDPSQARLDEAAKEVTLERSFTSVDQITKGFDGVVVASPPKFHLEQAELGVANGAAVLLEKPAAPTLKEALALQIQLSTSPAPLMLGYTYRWWSPLQEFRELIMQGAVGKPLHAKFVMSAHLADWHPWERYQDFFMASRELGGGALLDESHFIDLMIWMFGMPAKIFARVEQLSSLEIETDDNVDLVAVYPDGLRVTVHLDLFGRPHKKEITVTGENGTAEWTYEPNQIRLCHGQSGEWKTQEFNCQRNDMFLEMAKEFLEVIEGKRQPSCDIADGVNALRIVEACRKSAQTEKTVTLEN